MKYTIEEASSILKISKDALRKRIKRGTIEAEKTGNNWVISDIVIQLIQQDNKENEKEEQQEIMQDVKEKLEEEQQERQQGVFEEQQSRIIKYLEDEIAFLKKQLDLKDKSISELIEKIGNMQILLKNEQEIKLLKSENEINELEHMEKKKTFLGWFKK